MDIDKSVAELQQDDDLHDLFEHAPCGYVSTRPDGRIIKVNQTLLDWTGCAEGQLVGRRFQDLLNIAGKIYYETHFAPLLRMQGFFNEVAFDLVRADGGALPVLVNAVERRDDVGGLRFTRITIFNASDRRRYERDLLEARRAAEQANAELKELNATLEARVAEAVEERMRAEDTLRQAQKMEAVGQLTGGIAHDFNNMLAIVLSGLGLLERRLEKGDRDVGKYIVAAKEGAHRAAALTQRLLAFSRQQPLSSQALDTNRLVSEMSELLRRTLGATVRLKTTLAEDLWAAHADPSQLENAIVNLAVNARDAMPDGGGLTIETGNCELDDAYAAEHAIAPGEFVMVAVSDTGAGMPPEVAARAFEPFFTTKGVGKGTGLGLSQVFGFVKQSGGHVKIYSEPGQGTTVKLYLPRYRGPAEASKHSQAPAPARGSASELILVAEDDDQVRRLTAQMLTDLGYGVIEAACAGDALRALEANPETRLLFTDVVMPDMSGLRLADEATKTKPGLKVLFTTGYAPNAVVQNGLLDPGSNLLPKPATLEQMAAKVRSVLDER